MGVKVWKVGTPKSWALRRKLGVKTLGVKTVGGVLKLELKRDFPWSFSLLFLIKIIGPKSIIMNDCNITNIYFTMSHYES